MGIFEDQSELWQRVAVQRLTASGRVCLGPCYIFSCGLTADSAGVATASIYDGAGSGGDLIINLGCITSDKDFRSFPVPFYLRKGLYVAVGSNVEGVTIQYLSIRE